MADFGGFDTPTPQEVIARLQAQRQQAFLSGNPTAARTANTQRVLDTLFGNPEVERAKKVTDAIKIASGVKQEDGEDDLDFEIRRLGRIRDAVDALDPALANQVRQQQLAVRQQQFQRSLLLSKERRAESEEGRAQLGFEQDYFKTAREMAAGNPETWFDQATGMFHAVDNDNPAEVQVAKEKGWIPMKATYAATKAEDLPGKLGKKGMNELDAEFIKAERSKQNLSFVASQWRPEYSTLPTQLAQSGVNLAERIAGQEAVAKVAPELAAQAQQYQYWTAAVLEMTNQYIHDITGAQMSQYETKRLLGAIPNPGDGPTKFVSKLRNVARTALAAEKRTAELRKYGYEITSRDDYDKFPLDQYEVAVSEADIDELLGITKEGKRVTPESADTGEWREVSPGVRIRLKP